MQISKAQIESKSEATGVSKEGHLLQSSKGRTEVTGKTTIYLYSVYGTIKGKCLSGYSKLESNDNDNDKAYQGRTLSGCFRWLRRQSSHVEIKWNGWNSLQDER